MALWTGLLAPDRACDWSLAGVVGGIPTTRTRYTTLGRQGQLRSYAQTVTAAQINTAIQACPVDQYVLLLPGTYTLSTALVMKTGVTLRGSGAFLTILKTTPTSFHSGAAVAGVYFDGGSIGANPVANLTGAVQGATQVTYSTTNAALATNNITFIDQADNSYPPGQGIVCGDAPNASGGFSAEGAGIVNQANRGQVQTVKVTNKTGSVITFTPGLYLPNWGDRSVQARWPSSVISDAGLEDVTLDQSNWTTGGSSYCALSFFCSRNCWVDGVRFVWSAAKDLAGRGTGASIWYSSHNTVANSYFYGMPGMVTNTQEQYAIELAYASDCLVENNAIQHNASPIRPNAEAPGCVFAFNYNFDNFYGSTSDTRMQSTIGPHATCNLILSEGNKGPGVFADTVHGTHNMLTFFRNYFDGHDIADARTVNANPFLLYSFSRYYNLLGNVLGKTGWATGYEGLSRAIYRLGEGTPASGSEGMVPDDAEVAATLMRWGNYDVINNAVQWTDAERATAAALFPGLALTSHTLPESFYRSTRPSFFTVNGSTVTYPPIGPDVSGGNDNNPAVGAHANKIPAQVAYDSFAVDPLYPTADTSGGYPVLWEPGAFETNTGILTADMYVDMAVATAEGTALTPAIVLAGTKSVSNTAWTIVGSNQYFVGPHTRVMPCSVQVGATVYPPRTTTKSWRWIPTTANTPHLLRSIPTSPQRKRVSWGCYITIAPDGYYGMSSYFDMVVLWCNGGSGGFSCFQLQERNPNSDSVINIETNPGGSTQHSAYYPIVPGLTYWCTLVGDLNTGLTSARLYDPATWQVAIEFANVNMGTGGYFYEISCPSQENGTNRNFEIGHIYEHLVVDWTNGVYPLLPNLSSGATPPTGTPVLSVR
jgi:hypothetical protein